jgi:flagellar biosynthesis protein FliQ
MEKLQQPEKVSNILPGIAWIVCMLSLAVSTSPLIVTCTISATPVHEGQLTRIPEIIELR